MADNVSYGWMGWIARVNLSTGEITEESDEAMQKDYIGGMGFANKIMYDEVPAGVDWMDEENKAVLCVGPLTGSGVPLAGRSTWATLSTFTTDHLVVDCHCGGQLGAKLKYSGHDGLIIEGKADKPVYIYIDDDKISIEDASALWGKGTRETNEALCKKHGVDVCVAAIGPAGENLLPYACVINTRSHSAGAGLGAVLGSKNVKAVVVRGTKGVNVADPQMVADLSDYMIDQVIGSNNNHVVPSTQQSWAEYYDKGSRWTARKGLYWAAAEGGPIETGEPKPHEPNTMGYRCMKSTKDLGPEAEKYTVKMAGCHGCPVRCYAQVKQPQILEMTGYESMGNTCVPNFPFSSYMQSMMKVPAPRLRRARSPSSPSCTTCSSRLSLTIWACGATMPSSTAISPTPMWTASSSASSATSSPSTASTRSWPATPRRSSRSSPTSRPTTPRTSPSPGSGTARLSGRRSGTTPSGSTTPVPA